MKKRRSRLKFSDELRPEHDLRRLLRTGVRGKYAKCYQTGTNLVLLDPDVRRAFRDEKAVNAAVVLPWSNGQVEGQIHRLKLVKRQMYGRAKFNLLRRRVLPYVAAPDAVSPQSAP